ncbi:interleukin-3 receptor subunit alpha-like isoform X2 [Notamacropus eugenii]|uniref:interleukin-3 receptor subunit alpha-like isoform X2 n=2 Tax=Notamacropus eugenii TaxID=9315 RepID=UPI003B680F63
MKEKDQGQGACSILGSCLGQEKIQGVPLQGTPLEEGWLLGQWGNLLSLPQGGSLVQGVPPQREPQEPTPVEPCPCDQKGHWRKDCPQGWKSGGAAPQYPILQSSQDLERQENLGAGSAPTFSTSLVKAWAKTKAEDPVLKSGSMADLITFVWFSMLLTLTYSQRPTQEVSDSPIKNITFDMKTMLLRWTNVENVKDISCSVKVRSEFKYGRKATNNNSMCELKGYNNWCQGVDIEIKGFAGKRFSETLLLPQRGEEGTTNEIVSCQVHDANLMDCKWTVRETPRNIQYQFFYSQNPRTYADRECPEYKRNSEGRHDGCHFNNLTEFTSNEPYHFLVIGTSRGEEVQCNDDYISLNKIEIFEPPVININCTEKLCYMEWQIPKRRELWDTDFEYELIIQKVTDDTVLESIAPLSITNYAYKTTNGKRTVKIRTRNLTSKNWSEWSKPQEFGHEDARKDIPPPVLSLFGIVCIMLIIMGYLCKRYNVIQKIFPPVPHIKDQVSDSFHKYIQVVWEENKTLPEQCKIEEIQVFEKKSNRP